MALRRHQLYLSGFLLPRAGYYHGLDSPKRSLCHIQTHN